MNEPEPRIVRSKDDSGEARRPHERSGRSHRWTSPTGAGTALLLFAFIMLPSAVLGVLSWRAIETQKSYSLERLRASYRQFALLAVRQLEYQLLIVESRWNGELDELLNASQGRPTAEQLTAFAGRQPLIAGYFLLGPSGQILYPPTATGEQNLALVVSGQDAQVRERDLFTRLVARGEELEYGAGDLKAAIVAYREILSQIKSQRLQAMAESYIGRAQLKDGNRTEALSTFRRLLERYPYARDLNRMYLRFLAQYQIAVLLEDLGRNREALDVLLELNRDLLKRSDAITTPQYSFYSDLIQDLAPKLLRAPRLRNRSSYEQAFHSLAEQNKKRISEKYFLHLLDAELSEMSLQERPVTPQTRYLSSRTDEDPFLLAYRVLTDARQTQVTGILAAQIDLKQLQQQLSAAIRTPTTESEADVAILGSEDGALIGAKAAPGILMATQDLAEPYDFWRVAVYLRDVPTAMKHLDLRHTLWLWLISLMLLSIFLGGYLFILKARRLSYISRAQTTFVSNVTHELRAPLASIKMFTELLEMQGTAASKDARARLGRNAGQYLNIIRQECDRLSRLLDGVIDFSRMERNVKQYRFEQHDVGAVVSRAVETFRPHADARGFSLQLSVEEPLPPLRLDADAILQVLVNLLTNAVQYSDEVKEIRVRVAREGSAVVIDVTDRGIGIAPEDIRKVFDRFYSSWRRMDSRVQAGLGLGLTLSREIVREHGGEISVQSKVGLGSTFRVTLPAPVSPETSSERQHLAPEHLAVEPVGGRRG